MKNDAEEVAVAVVVRPRESPYARRLMYAVLGLVVFVVMPAYVVRELTLLRDLARSPVSRVMLFGEPHDPHEMARRLNADGVLVSMDDVLDRAIRGCAAAADATAATLGPAFPPGRETAVSFTVDGTERHAVVYVPESYAAATAGGSASPVALMVLFHGLNDNCEHFLNATGFLPHAEREGFVIVSACGSQGYLGTAWNSGMCCGFSDDKPDDVRFAKQIADEMSDALCIDEEKVMAVGFSNGAMLAEVLACELPAVYRAAVSIGGVVELRPGNAEGLAACTAMVNAGSHRTSVLMVHGTSDVMVPWGGNRLIGFPSVEANVAAWAERNACPADSATTTISTTKYSNTLFGECGNASSPGHVTVWDSEREDRAAAYGEDVAEAVATIQLADPLLLRSSKVEMLRKKKHEREHEHEHEHEKRHEDDGEDEDEYRGGRDDGKANGEEEDRHTHRGKTDKEGKRHGHKHGPKHGHKHGHKHDCPPSPKHPRHPGADAPPPPPSQPKRWGAETGTVYPVPLRSQIELVRVEGGSHRWPEDDEFSTTGYIIEFGARVFGSYTSTTNTTLTFIGSVL